MPVWTIHEILRPDRLQLYSLVANGLGILDELDITYQKQSTDELLPLRHAYTVLPMIWNRKKIRDI